MNFDTQVCTTREQSERLLALGLNKETADCFIWSCDDKDYVALNFPDSSLVEEGIGDIYAWSLHRLITMLPKYCKREYYLSIEGNDIHYKLIGTTEYGISHYSFYKKKNLYSNIIDCIEWLIKNSHFKKEYLEE